MTYISRPPTRARLQELMQDLEAVEARLGPMEAELDDMGIDVSRDPAYLAERSRAENLISLIDDIMAELEVEDEPKRLARPTAAHQDASVIRLIRGY
jgi:hypothetical protein